AGAARRAIPVRSAAHGRARALGAREVARLALPGARGGAAHAVDALAARARAAPGLLAVGRGGARLAVRLLRRARAAARAERAEHAVVVGRARSRAVGGACAE